MVERNDLVVDVVRGESCKGRREQLLSLAALRDEAPDRAATEHHLRACAPCRALLETLRMELRLGADAWSELRARHHPRETPPFDLAIPKSFASWLDAELSHRTEQELAHALARAARWLLRLDSEVAARTETSEPSACDGHSIIVELEGLLALHQRDGSAFQSLLRDLKALLASADSRIADATRLAGKLLESARELCGGRSGFVWLNSAIFEWFHGELSQVPGLLERAERHAQSADTRACALQNLGIHASDRGEHDLRFALLRRALLARPSANYECDLHVTLATWHASIGELAAAKSHLRATNSNGARETTRHRYPRSRIRTLISELSIRYDLQTTPADQAVALLIEAIHGTR
ncbi:MAG: hypothetical protein EXS13_10885 [Planctomycetes bacterium]|nr:hypothetical protein [Planctomycetota bacterium]